MSCRTLSSLYPSHPTLCRGREGGKGRGAKVSKTEIFLLKYKLSTEMEQNSRSRVGRISGLDYIGLPLLLARLLLLEQGKRLLGGDEVRDVPEGDRLDELLGREVGDELPKRLVATSSVEVPEGVADGSSSDGDDSVRAAEEGGGGGVSLSAE